MHSFFPRFLVDINTCHDVVTRCRRKIAIFWCLERGVLVPLTKTIRQGKVNTYDFGAYDAIVPVTSFPKTSVYCIGYDNYLLHVTCYPRVKRSWRASLATLRNAQFYHGKRIVISQPDPGWGSGQGRRRIGNSIHLPVPRPQPHLVRGCSPCWMSQSLVQMCQIRCSW